MSAPHNPPAFPNDPRVQLGDDYQGMTIRDWFAGQVLPAIISATSAGQHHPTGLHKDKSIDEAMAFDAYSLADAMLAERERKQ